MAGTTAGKKPSLRKCIGCMELKEKKDLLRLYIGEDGKLLIDKTFKAGGRGAYICNAEACLKKAVKRRALEHSLKIRISEEDYDRIGINDHNDG